MLTILTPTGERPEAFALCKAQMQRQTFAGPVYWIIVDDGQAPSDVAFKKTGWKTKIIRPRPHWKPGENTQARNLIAGLDEAERYAQKIGKPLRLTVWEDDDYYAPGWLEKINAELDLAELVGEGLAHYYNVKARRFKPLHNYQHASLRCSAMRGGAIGTFREVLQTFSMYYDFKLWKAHKSKRVFFSDLTVGIKGMPGRPGLAVGHNPENGRDDPELAKLRKMIGDDAELYEKFYEEPEMSKANEPKQMRAVSSFKYGERGLVKAGEVFKLRSNSEEALFLACGRATPVDAPTAEVQPQRRRKLKVETPEAKLADSIVEKSTEETNETPADENREQSEDESEPTEETARFGVRRRGRKSKDD